MEKYPDRIELLKYHIVHWLVVIFFSTYRYNFRVLLRKSGRSIFVNDLKKRRLIWYRSFKISNVFLSLKIVPHVDKWW